MAIITVKPAPGRVLRDPGNFMRLLDPDGSPVEDNSYWRRRINDGDAIVVDDADAPAEGSGPLAPNPGGTGPKAPGVPDDVAASVKAGL